MLNDTSNSTDIALRTYRPDTSAREMVVRLAAGETRRAAMDKLTARRFGDRFDRILANANAPRRAPFIAPIALLAVIAAGAVLKLNVGG